jgi:hypothetical protein
LAFTLASSLEASLGAPGITGTPCAWAKARASTLSPNSFRLAGEGPMKRSPSALQRSAKSVFSDKKP